MVKVPVGLGVESLPTATVYVCFSWPSSRRARRRSGRLTTMTRMWVSALWWVTCTGAGAGIGWTGGAAGATAGFVATISAGWDWMAVRWGRLATRTIAERT